MICKPYRAEIPERTCIYRQHIIATLSHKKSDWFNVGPKMLIHDACKKCRKGKALYAKAKETGDLPDIKIRRHHPHASKVEMDIMDFHATNANIGSHALGLRR